MGIFKNSGTKRELGLCFLIAAAFTSISAIGQSAVPRHDLIEQLMPDGAPQRLQLPGTTERDSVIRRLKAVQANAHGTRAQQVAFLLAAMNVDYERNRNFLLWVFKGCNVPEVKNGCDDMTGTYLAYLYEHGHAELLKPLMTGLNSYNAAGSEFIGSFLSELVAKNHAEFLNAIRNFPAPEQKKICYFTGLADGGGMSPADLRQTRRQLGAMQDAVARHCLQQIEKANRQQ